jgi:hypothetical protein
MGRNGILFALHHGRFATGSLSGGRAQSFLFKGGFYDRVTPVVVKKVCSVVEPAMDGTRSPHHCFTTDIRFSLRTSRCERVVPIH